jgi:hypothetical protein
MHLQVRQTKQLEDRLRMLKSAFKGLNGISELALNLDSSLELERWDLLLILWCDGERIVFDDADRLNCLLFVAR